MVAASKRTPATYSGDEGRTGSMLVDGEENKLCLSALNEAEAFTHPRLA